MAKSKSGHRPGGGIASRNVVQKPVRTGRGASAIIPAGSAQLGARQGNHFTQGGAGGRKQSNYGGVDIYSTGPGYNKARYGNEVAKNVGGGGPGKGRTLYGQSGSQGCHGSVASGNPPAKGELFPGWPAKR